MMIGQRNLLKTLEQQIKNDKFPRFSIFVGMRGSGKSLVAEHVADWLHANYITLSDLKIDSIRDLIQQSYKIMAKTVYVLNHADEMSQPAQNALLKVMEEPPNNAYFIMTLEDINNTLLTIRSRGAIYNLDNYSQDELFEYVQTHYDIVLIEEKALMLKLCETPGELKLLHSMNVIEFTNFVYKVFQYITSCSGANAFKIAQSIKLKDDEDGYDLKLFWKAFAFISFAEYQAEGDPRYLHESIDTSEVLSVLRFKSVNKHMLFDKWILDVRREWLAYD